MEFSYKRSWNGSKEEVNMQAEERDGVNFPSSSGDELNYREFKLKPKNKYQTHRSVNEKEQSCQKNLAWVTRRRRGQPGMHSMEWKALEGSLALPREVEELPSLKDLRKEVDMGLNAELQLTRCRLNSMILEVFCSLNNSVFL